MIRKSLDYIKLHSTSFLISIEIEMGTPENVCLMLEYYIKGDLQIIDIYVDKGTF